MNISVVSNMINTTIMLNMCICIILGLIVSNIMHTWITLLNMCRSYTIYRCTCIYIILN